MWEDESGFVWVISMKADARWAETTTDDYPGRYDSVIEARDATTGELVASREFDEYATGFSHRGRLILFDLDEQDQPRHRLIRLSLPGLD